MKDPNQGFQETSPAVTLTVGQLRELVRQEVQAAIRRPEAEPRETHKPYLTVKEASELSGLAPSTVRLYIRKRQLKARKVGRRVIIAGNDLEAFLNRNPTGLPLDM